MDAEAERATQVLRSLGYEYVPGPTDSPSDWLLSPGFAWKGQADYDAVARACTAWVRAQLVPLCGLVHLTVGKATAYATPGLATHVGPVLLLVCGSAPGGDAGIWGRSLCINDSTLSGSMFETVSRAKSRGWAVVVADPHGATDAPHKHLLTLYRMAEGRPTLILGHSYGAAMAIGVLKAIGVDGLSTVTAVALTDGMVWTPAGWRGGRALVHEERSAMATDAELEEAADDEGSLAALRERRAELRQWVEAIPSAFEPPSDALLVRLAEVGRNWVTSDKALGARVAVPEKVMPTVSAAVTAHPSTTHVALDDVFAFLDRAVGRRKRAPPA